MADPKPSPGTHAKAFASALAGTGDIAPDDPHRWAKGLAAFVSLAITGLFVWNTVADRKSTYRSGYRAGRAAARAQQRKT